MYDDFREETIGYKSLSDADLVSTLIQHNGYIVRKYEATQAIALKKRQKMIAGYRLCWQETARRALPLPYGIPC